MLTNASTPVAVDGVKAKRLVSSCKNDPATGERFGLLATGIVGDGGWVEMAEPIIVRAGEAFIVMPEALKVYPDPSR